MDVMYTDMSKAFDKVNHVRLVANLQNFGFRGSLLNLIRSYLSDRSQAVRFESAISLPLTVTLGIPQGSYLGPVHFRVYINDLISRIATSKVLLYADDVKIFAHVRSLRDAYALQTWWWCRSGRVRMSSP